MAHARTESIDQSTAASLFAADAASNDFFANLEPEPQYAATVPDRHLSPEAATAHSATDASSLFSTTASSDPDSLWTAQTAVDDAQHGVPNGAAYHYTAEQGNYEYEDDSQSVATDPYANQGWYDEYGQWHEYGNYSNADQSWAQGSTYDNVTQDAYPAAQAYDYTNNYDPGPAASTGYSPQGQQYHSYNTYGSTVAQNPYDPYAPAATTYATPTAGPTATSTSLPVVGSATQSAHRLGSQAAIQPSAQQTYDPYQPTSATNIALPVSHPSQLSQANSYSYSTPEPTVAAPQSRAKPAEAYRTTSYNAYDPPVLDRPRRTTKTPTVPPPPLAPNTYYGAQSQFAQPPQPPLPPPPPPPPPRAQSAYYSPPAPQPSTFQPLPMAPTFPERIQSPPRSSYDPYAPTPENVHSPPRSQRI